MKTPQEAGYPTREDTFEKIKNYIEHCVDNQKFTRLEFSSRKITPELETWLLGYGWKLDVSYVQRDEEYISLIPL